MKTRTRDAQQSVANAGKKTAKQAEAESAVKAKIAAMPELWRGLGERLHGVILRSAPALRPRVWYGMPAYELEGNTVCFFRADKRWMTFGFTQEANLTLEEGAPHQLIGSAWFFTDLDEATDARVAELVRRVTS